MTVDRDLLLIRRQVEEREKACSIHVYMSDIIYIKSNRLAQRFHTGIPYIFLILDVRQNATLFI